MNTDKPLKIRAIWTVDQVLWNGEPVTEVAWFSTGGSPTSSIGYLEQGEAWRTIDSTREDLQPQVSPDGRRLAFLSDRSGFYEVWTSGLDGRRLRRNSDFRGAVVNMPRWSPDSRRRAARSHAWCSESACQ
ncbi:MAG: hypothetical protein V3T83_19375 [Acidobacteriota bacterium]